MAPDAHDCTCPSDSVSCPECHAQIVTSVPFSRTGREANGQCAVHGTLRVTLTKLHRARITDERGYLACPSCGLVLDETPELFPTSDQESNIAHDSGASTFGYLAVNHHARILHDLGMTSGSAPMSSRERMQIVRLAEWLYDVDPILSRLHIKGDLKTEIHATVEAYFHANQTSNGRGGGVRYEAIVTALVEEVLVLRGVTFDSADLWGHYSILENARTQARKRVGSWFHEYTATR